MLLLCCCWMGGTKLIIKTPQYFGLEDEDRDGIEQKQQLMNTDAVAVAAAWFSAVPFVVAAIASRHVAPKICVYL